LKAPIIVVGTGGHAAVIADAIREADEFQIVGCLDDHRPVGEAALGVTVIGRICDARACATQTGSVNFAVAIGDNWMRGQVFERLAELESRALFPVVKHPSAVVSRSSEIGDGTALLAQSVVGPGCRAGRGCIVNTNASLDHDSELGDFSSLGPGAITGGRVKIGRYSAVCLGANVIHRISIGANTVIGAGATVVRDTPASVVAWGNPSRVQRQRAEADPYL